MILSIFYELIFSFCINVLDKLVGITLGLCRQWLWDLEILKDRHNLESNLENK